MSITFTQPTTGATQIIYITQHPEEYLQSLDFSDARNTQYINTILTGLN
jgi:hypothetical protein